MLTDEILQLDHEYEIGWSYGQLGTDPMSRGPYPIHSHSVGDSGAAATIVQQLLDNGANDVWVRHAVRPAE